MLTNTQLRPSANSDIVLTDAEKQVVLKMREIQNQPRLGMLVVQCLGTQWKVHQTTMCEHLK